MYLFVLVTSLSTAFIHFPLAMGTLFKLNGNNGNNGVFKVYDMYSEQKQLTKA
jgi:hypothetical protein